MVSWEEASWFQPLVVICSAVSSFSVCHSPTHLLMSQRFWAWPWVFTHRADGVVVVVFVGGDAGCSLIASSPHPLLPQDPQLGLCRLCYQRLPHVWGPPVCASWREFPRSCCQTLRDPNGSTCSTKAKPFTYFDLWIIEASGRPKPEGLLLCFKLENK